MTALAPSRSSSDRPLLTAAARRGLGLAACRWAVAPALLCWLGLAALSSRDPGFGLCLAEAGEARAAFSSHVAARAAAADLASRALAWALMIGAMMLPLTVPALNHVVRSSLAFRRERAAALLLAGYLLVWALAFPVA
ncbi:MAG: DUF2182 domain-containing protein, partial [Sphingomonadaceae bacterium]